MTSSSIAPTLNTVWCIEREIALASRQNINRSKRILRKTLHLNHERHVPHIDFNFFAFSLSFPAFWFARTIPAQKRRKANTHQNILMSMACYGYGRRIDSPSRVFSLATEFRWTFCVSPNELVTYEALKRAAGFTKTLQFMESLPIKFNWHLIKIVWLKQSWTSIG